MTVATTIDVPAIEATEVVTETIWTGFDFTVDTKSIKSAIDTAFRAVSPRPSHAVLANLAIKVGNGSVSVTGFDLSLGIKISVPAVVQTAGHITLPAKFLSDVINRLPVGDVRFKQDKDTVTVSVGRTKFKVKGLHIADFPELPDLTEDSVVIPSEKILALAGAVDYAVSTDETKQVLTGVHVTIEAGRVEMAATDGHRLAVASSMNEFAETGEFTIPGRAFRELAKLVAKTEPDDLEFSFDSSQIQITGFGFKVTSRLIEGQYPNYRQLVPRQFQHDAVVDSKQFLAALERCRIVAEQQGNVVKAELDSKDGVVRLSADSGDSSISEEVMAQINGGLVLIKTNDGEDEEGTPEYQNFIFAINVKYLIDSLKSFESAEIKLYFNSPTSPIVIKGFEADEKTALLMPVQTRS